METEVGIHAEVKVYIDNVPKEIPGGVYTTEELKTALGVQPGYLLNLEEKDRLKPLRPNERTHVKDGMKFFSQVPGGASS